MVKMLHYDALLDCDTSDKKSSSSSIQAQHLSYLKEHPLEAVDKDSLSKVAMYWIKFLECSCNQILSGVSQSQIVFYAISQLLCQ